MINSYQFSEDQDISKLEIYQSFSKEFDYNIEFLEDLSNLITYNGICIYFLAMNKSYRLDTSLIDSCSQTLKSIKRCCSISSFADANILIRKLRDDLFFYLFIIDVIEKRNPFNENDLINKDLKSLLDNPDVFCALLKNIRWKNELSDNEQAVYSWFQSNISDLPNNIKKKLSFENYMQHLKQNEDVAKIMKNFKLDDYWEKLRYRLNNYVHNNGYVFTLQNIMTFDYANIEISLANINYRISYILSIFLVLLLMVKSSLIGSTDYMDHLECDMKPLEDSQYDIAPFVQQFIDEKVKALHPELKLFLQAFNNNGMVIE